ncbi:alpha/beta hydrolase [Streptomyces sp. NPDC048290]|uniref:alpha/beta fold hydrolase n=1 Tax=Streptomyces sp. NPDC048290 TaxID=3155811 RepID=UPI0034438000
MVFVHGFLDDQYVWDPLIAELDTSGTEYITLDLAGSGDRAAADGPFTYDRFAAEVGAVVDAVGRPFVIVGQSMGAAVAELVAAQRPDRALGLVLITPVPLSGIHLPDEAIGQFQGLGGDGAGQRAVRGQLSATMPDGELDRLVAVGERVPPQIVRDFADCWNNGHPSGGQASGYTGPVLILHGEADGFVTEELVSTAVAPRFCSVESVSVPSGGHWVHLEQTAMVAAHVERFLAALSRPGVAPAPEAAGGQGWTGAFTQKSAAAFGAAFAPDVELEASVLTRPIHGREQVMAVMGTASTIYESLTFARETTDGDRTYLEWEATAFGGLAIQGVTVLTKDADGQIRRGAIHHRPLGAALRFSAELRDRLRGRVAADHFHQS